MLDAMSLGFIHGDLNRFAHKRIDPAWIEAQLKDRRSRFIGFVGDKVLLDFSEPDRSRIAYEAAGSAYAEAGQPEPVFLGQDDLDRSIFAFRIEEWAEDTMVKPVDLRSVGIQGLVQQNELGWLAQARSLLFWHERHPFCAVCGHGTDMVDAGYRRVCPSCNASHFPRTDPVAIVIVVRNGKLLLGRGHHFIDNMYSTLAGFVEPGETLEDAARREIFEESGIRIGKVTYHSNQPWPFPSNLMVGMIGEGLSDDITMEEAELADCRWFSKSEVEAMFEGTHPDGLTCPPSIAIAHHLIKAALEF